MTEMPKERKKKYFVFMDAIHNKIKENHQYVTKAAYVVLGIRLDGKKDILGVWIGEDESSKIWLSVLNVPKNRGVQDVCVFCVDGLNGFREVVGEHTLSHKFNAVSFIRFVPQPDVSYKDIKALMADLKPVYQAVNEDEGMVVLVRFTDKWGKVFPPQFIQSQRVLIKMAMRCLGFGLQRALNR